MNCYQCYDDLVEESITATAAGINATFGCGSTTTTTPQRSSLHRLRALSQDHIDQTQNQIQNQNQNQTQPSTAGPNTSAITSKSTAAAGIEHSNNNRSSFIVSLFSSIMGNKHSNHNDNRDLEYGESHFDYYEDNPHRNSISNSNPRRQALAKYKQNSSSSSSSKRHRHHKLLDNNHSTNNTNTNIDDIIYDHDAQQYYTLNELVDRNIYVVRQKYGTWSILFSVIQTVILIAMMCMCSIAPLNINPMVGPYPDALDYWGAKNTAKMLDENEWWRLFTPLLLHGGIIHLLCNISVQIDIGAFFEREWGSAIWLIIYILSGIGSTIFSCIFSPDNLSVGSSGAVMGLFGGKLAEIFCRACESRKTQAGRVGHEVRMEQLQQSLCSVILVLAFSFVPYVDWAAHLGGVICGFITGMMCFSPWIKTRYCAVFWFSVGIGFNAVFYILSLSYLFTYVEPNGNLKDVCGYYQQYFQDYECNCQLDNGR